MLIKANYQQLNYVKGRQISNVLENETWEMFNHGSCCANAWREFRNMTGSHLSILSKLNILPPDPKACLCHDWVCGISVLCCLSSGLGLLVTWLSDPDNLNQLVLSQLDSTTPKGSEEELCGSDPERASLASQEGKYEGKGSQVWVAVIFHTLLQGQSHTETQSNDYIGNWLLWKLQMTCLFCFSGGWFLGFAGAWREPGFHPPPGSRTKRKVCFFCDWAHVWYLNLWNSAFDSSPGFW